MDGIVRLTRKRVGIGIAAAVLVASGGAAFATGSISAIVGADGVIHGCYKEQNGQLRVVAAVEACGPSERPIQWSEGGPAGPAGATGTKGEPGAPGAQGPQGPAGTNGANGVNGTNGQDGSDAASALTGRIDVVELAGASRTIFAYPEGHSESADQIEENVVFLTPNATILAQDLAVQVTFPDPEFFGQLTFTLRDDGTDTAVSCVLVSPALTCNSAGSTATISPGSELSLKIFRNCVFDCWNPSVRFGWRATTP